LGEKIYNKLVRDRTPEIIRSNGDECSIEILDDEEYIKMLDKMLDEEVVEYHADNNIEKLADIMEGIFSVARVRGCSVERLEKIQQDKVNSRGSFAKKILLKKVFHNKLYSQNEFVRMVNIQSETLRKYISENKVKPDKVVMTHNNRAKNYFYEKTIKKYADEFGWSLITDDSVKKQFMLFVLKMQMTCSYKPLLLKAFFRFADDEGKARFSDIVDYFDKFYKKRRNNGLVAEKKGSIYYSNNCSKKQIENNILRFPFKRFYDMNFMEISCNQKYIYLNPKIYNRLSKSDIEYILTVCDTKLDEYYRNV